MYFRDFLHDSAIEINHDLESFFQKWSKDVEQISPRLLPYARALHLACAGGKRIRGSLVMLGFRLFSKNGDAPTSSQAKLNHEILKAALAYEIFQAAILAHDDIIDRSLTRRGVPSLYASLGGDHLGVSKAICLGDIGFFLAFKLISESSFPDKYKNAALAIFSRSMLDTGLGELLDVELGSSLTSNLNEVLTVYKYKTAYYTFTAPLLLGAVLSGRIEQDLKPIINFGQNIGIAFQIQDDINDIFSEKSGLGKDPGGDIKEGKKTLLSVYAIEHAVGKDRSLLKEYYGNPEIGKSEIEIVKKILIDTGSLEFAKKQAKSYADKAKEYISEITQDKVYQQVLLQITEHFIGKN